MDGVTSLESTDRAAEVQALLLLDALPGVGTVAVRAVLEHFGSARAAVAPVRRRALEAMVGYEAARALDEASVRLAAQEALSAAARLGMGVLLLREAAYPPRLLHLSDPPPLLFLRGDVELLSTSGIAIVGARRATARARDVAFRLGGAVARAGTPVVSGLALGVDGAAHRGALDAGGPTIAVLGRGADEAYPPTHRELYARILATGLAVSEFAPGRPPLPHHFPRRNRVLAALCSSVVVVEAGARSGALITVEHALDLGLDVWAVPGPIDEPTCVGSNALLAEGARPLVSIEAFVRDALGVDLEATSDRGPAPVGEEARVLAYLEDGTRSVDEVARIAGLPAGRALSLLSELELRGRVERVPGMRFRLGEGVTRRASGSA